MSLSESAYRNRTVVLFVTLLMMGWGIAAYFTMPRREDPEFTIRVCVVATAWPGIRAERVEELVTYPIEEAIDGIEEVDFVRSTTTTGLSTVFVELDDNVPPEEIETVWQKVRAEVDKVRMPEQGVKPIVDSNFGDTTILLFAVYQKPWGEAEAVDPAVQYSGRQMEIYADQIKDALRLIEGVADASTYGVREEAIYVESDLGNWSQQPLTIDSLKSLIEARNVTAKGGEVDTATGKFTLTPGGEFNTVDELNGIVVGLAQSGETTNQVYLRDIGLDVVRDYKEPPGRICRFGTPDGDYPAVMVGITMRSGANIVEVCRRARDRVQRMVDIEKSLPADLAVVPISDQSTNVSARIRSVISNVISAVVIVVLVVYLLVGFRSAAVMAANIPVVILISLAIVTLFGVQLEQISLASIIIALGLLVDNAVQVCDQSRTNQLQGMPPVPATVSGASALSIPMLTGTGTTIAAFLPMLVMLTGGGKEYVYSLPVTVSTTLAVSWIVAMTFCVLLAAAFIRVPSDGRPAEPPLVWLANRVRGLLQRKTARQSDNQSATARTSDGNSNVFYRVYAVIGQLALNGKFLIVLGSLVLFVAAIRLPVSTEFFPQDWRDQFVVEVWLPENATIAQTDAAAREVEDLIQRLSPTTNEHGKTVERLASFRTLVGGGGSRWHLGWNPESSKPNYAEILVHTTSGTVTPGYVDEIRRLATYGDQQRGIEPILEARVVPKELSLGPPAKPVELRLFGDGFADIATMRTYADRLKNLVADQPGTWNVFDTWGADGLQLDIDIAEDKANLAGLSNAQVAQTLNAYFSGRLMTTFREGEHTVPVYFRLNSGQRQSLGPLAEAYVEGTQGKVPLDSIAEVTTTWEPARIERREINRVIEVRAEVERGVSGNDVVNRILNSEEYQQLAADLPVGYRLEVGGSLADSRDASAEFVSSFGLSFVLILLILVVQYNSFSKPLIIIATLPLALIGALPGLYFTNNPLGFMPQLGIISLFGIVLNTGIIFLEFADLLIAEKREQKATLDGPIVGLTRQEFRDCLIAAGNQRMLPIFLTTATTIGGLIPLALSGGPLWEGMAWCMIFGLSVATLLTLLVVPALYAIVVETFGVAPLALEEK